MDEKSQQNYSDKENELIDTLREFSEQDLNIESCVLLQKALDQAYNEKHVQGPSVAISFEDQGAGPKLKTMRNTAHPGQRSSLQLDTNVAESAHVTSSKQTHASIMQAHRVDHAQSFTEIADRLLALKGPSIGDRASLFIENAGGTLRKQAKRVTRRASVIFSTGQG